MNFPEFMFNDKNFLFLKEAYKAEELKQVPDRFMLLVDKG